MSYTFLERQSKMLKLLAESHDYVQGNELAALANVSARTVRSDIVLINQMIIEEKDDCHFRIVSRKTKGYRIEVDNPERFRQFISVMEKKEEATQSNTLRENEIRLFILLIDRMTINRLCDLMYLSEFIIRKHLRKVQTILKKVHFNLTLSMSDNEVKITGSEHEIRLMILNILYVDPSNEIFSENLKPIISNPEFEKRIHNELIRHIKNQNVISLPARAIDFIARFLHISCLRNRMGYSIALDVMDILMISGYTAEMAIAKELCDFIQKKFGLILNRNDCYFLAAMIASFDQLKELDNSYFSSETVELCERIARKIFEITRNQDVNTYKDIQIDLLNYLYSFDLRTHFGIHRNYMGSSRIKRRRTVSVELARVLADEIESAIGKKLPPEEIVLLSVHIGNVFIRARAFSGKNDILISSRYGLCESNRFRNSLKFRYGTYIGEIAICETYEVEQIMDNYDLIFVDDHALAQRLNSPRVIPYNSYISVFQLEEQVKNRIKHEVTNATSLLSMMDQNSIVADYRAFRKGEILQFAALQSGGKPNEVKEIAEVLFERERQCSYECGNKVAVISIRHDCIDKPFIRFIVLNKVMLWERLQTQLIIVIYTSSDPINIRYCGGSINRLIANVDNINRLINKPSIKTLEELLRVF